MLTNILVPTPNIFIIIILKIPVLLGQGLSSAAGTLSSSRCATAAFIPTALVIIISIRITGLGFGPPARPGRPDRPRPTHFDRLGRSSRLPRRSESPRVAPSRSTELLRATKVDRKGRPSGPETRFSMIFGRFWGRFPRFFVADRARAH